MRSFICIAMLLLGCGGSTDEQTPALRVTRFVMPDATQAPYELSVAALEVHCAQIDCAPEIALPREPAELVATDALGNVFHIAIEDLALGLHVVAEPLAPEAGVFLEYRLEYEVR